MVGVGLHQGSALSPLLFIIMMDVIAENIAIALPRAMRFADDLELFEETKDTKENRIIGTFGIRVQTNNGQPGVINCLLIQIPGLDLRCGRRCWDRL